MVPLKNSWAFPVIEAAHVGGMALLAGTVILGGVQRLGWSVVDVAGDELDRIFKPWAHSGLAILLATGALMTFSDWERYRRNPAFWAKLALAALGLALYFSGKKKALTIAALICWTAVVLAARAIADFDI
jgi:hypothetical protein